MHTFHSILLPSLQDDDDEVSPDGPADAWDGNGEDEEAEEHGDVDGEVPMDDVPHDSVPTTDLDPEEPMSDDELDSDVEVIETDPYQNQPDNQLGLDDYESPRDASETPVATPEREEPKVTPGLRKAVHLDPEHLRDNGLGSSGASPSSAHSGATDLEKMVFSLTAMNLGYILFNDVFKILQLPLLVAGACDAHQLEIQAIIQELQRPKSMCECDHKFYHKFDKPSILWPFDTPVQA